MAATYSSYKRDWVDSGPMDVLGESQFGFHFSTIYFPRVRSCTALIARPPIGLCGLHLTIGDDEAALDEMMKRLSARTGGRATEIVLIGALPLLGQKCEQGSVYKYPAFSAEATRRLAGGAARPRGASLPPSPGADVRAQLTLAGLVISTRPVVAPFTPEGDWTPITVNTL
ncbi:MAG: hypothetical protein ACJA1L_003715 [Paracoccaceae bacterium]|jgi:hypothetical protein